MKDSEARNLCREKIESLEHWLRRLIDDQLSKDYGDYFNHTDEHGNRIIKSILSQKVEERLSKEPSRYPRKIDGILLEDAVDIICNPKLYNAHFKPALQLAFPEGHIEARTFLARILTPRNNLSHANPVSARQIEQVFCYTNDITDSIKEFYRVTGMQQSYNVPQILKVRDSFGGVFTRSQCSSIHDGGICIDYLADDTKYLRPGDSVSFEVEVDPSFDSAQYTLTWNSTKQWAETPSVGNRLSFSISNTQVGQMFDIQCSLVAKQDWHRMHMGADDFLMIYLKILPPI